VGVLAGRGRLNLIVLSTGGKSFDRINQIETPRDEGDEQDPLVKANGKVREQPWSFWGKKKETLAPARGRTAGSIKSVQHNQRFRVSGR